MSGGILLGGFWISGVIVKKSISILLWEIKFYRITSPTPAPLPSRKKFPSPGSCMLVSDVKEFGALRHLCQNLSTICCSPYNFLEREIFNFCAQQQSLNVLFYCLSVAKLIFKSLLTFNFFLFHQNTRRFCRLCSIKLNAT